MPGPGLRALRGLSDPTGSPNAAGLTAGFDMSPGVSRPLWPGRACKMNVWVRVLSFALKVQGSFGVIPGSISDTLPGT